MAAPKGKPWKCYLLRRKKKNVHDEENVTGLEIFGQHKAILIHKPMGPDDWQLLHLKIDLGEIHDLANAKPAKLRRMVDH